MADEWFLLRVNPDMDLESVGGQEWFPALITFELIVSCVSLLVGL